MSLDLHLACKKCEESIWIAQDGLGGFTLYWGEPDTMKHLAKFLQKHQGHELVFENWENHETYVDVQTGQPMCTD